MQSVSERLEKVRNEADLTWEQIAKELELSVSMLMQVKRGDRNLSSRSLGRLANLEVAAGIADSTRLHDIAQVNPDDHPNPYEHLETATLQKSLAELSAKLPALSENERKYVLGNLRDMLDELEQRELKTGHKELRATSDMIAAEAARRAIAAGDNKEVKTGRVEEAAKKILHGSAEHIRKHRS